MTNAEECNMSMIEYVYLRLFEQGNKFAKNNVERLNVLFRWFGLPPPVEGLLKARERERTKKEALSLDHHKNLYIYIYIYILSIYIYIHIPISYIIVCTVSQSHQKHNLYPSFPTAKVFVPLILWDVHLLSLHSLKRTLDRS